MAGNASFVKTCLRNQFPELPLAGADIYREEKKSPSRTNIPKKEKEKNGGNTGMENKTLHRCRRRTEGQGDLVPNWNTN